METSILVARILAAIYLAIGIGMLVNRKYYIDLFDELVDNKPFVLLGGWMAAALGVVLVTYHNIWINDWTVLVTIVGWAALGKGLLLMIFPSSLNTYKPLLIGSSFQWLAIFALLFGLTFAYFAFL